MRRLLTLAVLFACLSPGLNPQVQQPDPFGQAGRQKGQGTREMDPAEKRMQDERFRALNKERQQKLKDDTERLLKLATELKESVDQTNENILSIEVIRKAEQIEKLAKSVKERMKYEQTPNPSAPI
jgi:hypothetical protein